MITEPFLNCTTAAAWKNKVSYSECCINLEEIIELCCFVSCGKETCCSKSCFVLLGGELGRRDAEVSACVRIS